MNGIIFLDDHCNEQANMSAEKKHSIRHMEFVESDNSHNILPASIQVNEVQLSQVVVLQQRGEISTAIALCKKILAGRPNDAEAWECLGTLELKKMEYTRAIDTFDRALAIAPDKSILHARKAFALQNIRHYKEALIHYDHALRLNPDAVETWFNRGLILQTILRNEEALSSYDRALAMKPDYVEAYSNRGNVLYALGRYEQALASFDQALTIRPHSSTVRSNRGGVLLKLNRYAEALESYDCAISIKPDYAEAIANRGNVLMNIGRIGDALAAYAHTLAIDPTHAGANFNEALCYLLLGNFQPGWRKFEWRWHTSQLKRAKRNFSRPIWLGKESLKGKIILLHAEQGLGDTIQFSRYINWTASLGATVFLEVQRDLKPLFIDFPGTSKIFVRGDPLPYFDFHCPLMSLPLVHETTNENIPAVCSYLFNDKVRANSWKKRLGNKKNPRIGLVWSGSSGHVNDHNRSIPLRQFLNAIPDNVDMYCLQKEVRSYDKEILALRKDIQFFDDQIVDFLDTVALIESMDIIVTVDTAVAHLSATMGKPVWILLSHAPDWRWLMDRSDSLWYPTAKLYRQKLDESWDVVIKQVAQHLTELFS